MCIAKNICVEKNFAISSTVLMRKKLSHKFLSHVNEYMYMYIEPMATFTTWTNANVAGLGDIFVQRKFSAVQYNTTLMHQSCGNYDWANTQITCMLHGPDFLIFMITHQVTSILAEFKFDDLSELTAEHHRYT